MELFPACHLAAASFSPKCFDKVEELSHRGGSGRREGGVYWHTVYIPIVEVEVESERSKEGIVNAENKPERLEAWKSQLTSLDPWGSVNQCMLL